MAAAVWRGQADSEEGRVFVGQTLHSGGRGPAYVSRFGLGA